MEKPICDAPAGTCLIETMLWQPGQGVALAERHRDRMEQSAKRLGFDFDSGAFYAALTGVSGDTAQRLRLTLDSAGQLALTTGSVPAPASGWHIAIAPQRLDSSDTWLQVKSTNRALYDTVRAMLPQGIDEAIFLNEHGHLCEGTITNLLVAHNDDWLTPPLSDGVLPGVMRAELLARGTVHEATLTLADLKSAPHVRLCNALRGVIDVTGFSEWPA